MSEFISNVYRERVDFSKIKSMYPIPDLLDVQKASYQRFLQGALELSERTNIGLQAVLKSVFPIRDFRDTCSLDYIEYDVGEPKYTIDECKERGMTYAVPLKVKDQSYGLGQGPGNGRAVDSGHQGGVGLLRRHSTDD